VSYFVRRFRRLFVSVGNWAIGTSTTAVWTFGSLLRHGEAPATFDRLMLPAGAILIPGNHHRTKRTVP
jgi:hypothetical protein